MVSGSYREFTRSLLKVIGACQEGVGSSPMVSGAYREFARVKGSSRVRQKLAKGIRRLLGVRRELTDGIGGLPGVR
ncbi:hypothetical protein BHE74_00030246 [Ensete ventricosum]|nr:hypothetical protein BHE74_00030246 [Ensete ventricosum]